MEHAKSLKRKHKQTESSQSTSGQVAKKQRTLVEVGSGRVSKDTMEKLIVKHIVEDMQSERIVESQSFRAIIHAAVPNMTMCAKTLGTKIEAQVNEVKHNIIDELKQVKCVSTTADIWTSRQRSYLAMTCHWFGQKDLVRRSAMLAFRRIKGEHNYKAIATMLNNIHSEYGLESSRISYVVTDNGSNFLKAFREYGIQDNVTATQNHGASAASQDDLSDTDDHDNENLEIVDVQLANVLNGVQDEEMTDVLYLPKHLSCSAHSLNLLTSRDSQAALTNHVYKTVYRSINAKCSALSNAVHRSSKSAEICYDVLKRTIPKPNTTRWNSEYDCMETIHKMGIVKINTVLEKLKLPKFKPDEFEFLGEWVKTMSPFAAALDLLQGEHTNEAYFGAILPTMLELYKKLEAMSSTSIKYCTPLVQALKTGMESRFPNLLSFDKAYSHAKEYIIAAVSHPYFRLRWINPADKPAAQVLFLHELKKNTALDSNLSAANDAANICTDAEHRHGSSSSDSFFAFTHDVREITDATTSITNEGMSYLQDTQFSKDLSSTLKQYPAVENLFRLTNTATPSSAPVERVFSSAGLIFLPRRNRLSDKKFENLLFLKKNSTFF